MAEYNSCCSNQSFSGLITSPFQDYQIFQKQLISCTGSKYHNHFPTEVTPLTKLMPYRSHPPNKQKNTMPDRSHPTDKQTNPTPYRSHPPNKQTNTMPDRSHPTDKQTNPTPYRSHPTDKQTNPVLNIILKNNTQTQTLYA